MLKRKEAPVGVAQPKKRQRGGASTLKTTERDLMGQQNLKNLMLWHIMGYTTEGDGKKVKMKSCDVPVMAILKEFRTMAFENGARAGACPTARRRCPSTTTRSAARPSWWRTDVGKARGRSAGERERC